MQSFPEVDQACFFPVEEASRKLKEAQTAFLDRLVEALGSARILRA
jgi:predicted NUDIX family NTP pyrophosphohydrolase